LLNDLTDSWGAAIEFITETDAELARAVLTHQVERARYAAPDRVPLEIRQAAADALQYTADTPPVANGRIELLWFMREQSLSVVYHRYGNLGARSDEPRDEPL
jgi:RHH-type proline utilization regulon transcriptional repressor/proline dehydrogenase/delta 1-pyrroline-5-carboxylate dehydrogenase